jgi:hypothetical protein
MAIKKFTAAPTAALALGLLLTPPVSVTIDAVIDTVAAFVPAAIGNLSFTSRAMGQPGPFTKRQSDALVGLAIWITASTTGPPCEMA